MPMHGERLQVQHQFGAHNSPHKYGYFMGKGITGIAVLGPRREAHNKTVKRLANRERRRGNNAAISQSLADWEGAAERDPHQDEIDLQRLDDIETEQYARDEEAYLRRLGLIS